MVTKRVDMRLDEEHEQKLKEIIDARSTTVSDIFRRLIDREYEAVQLERRRELLKEILATEIPDDVPDIEELNRQLDEAHDPGIP